jgi:hypothetical protein
VSKVVHLAAMCAGGGASSLSLANRRPLGEADGPGRARREGDVGRGRVSEPQSEDESPAGGSSKWYSETISPTSPV